jgi:hypothetical protein
MARARQHAPSHDSEDLVLYRRPDPVLVAKIVDDYSYDAACERWGSLSTSTITTLAREGRRLQAARGVVDTSAMRDCVECTRPFFSDSAANVVCRICRAESKAVFA